MAEQEGVRLQSEWGTKNVIIRIWNLKCPLDIQVKMLTGKPSMQGALEISLLETA